MRIIFVVHQFLPDFFSGTETLTYKTAKFLQNRGHDVTIFTGFPGKKTGSDHGRFDQYQYDGIEVIRFHFTRSPMGKQHNVVELEYNNKFVASFFYRFIRKYGPDLVHVFHFDRISTAIINECSQLDIPIIFTPTDFWFICPMMQLLLPDDRICQGPSNDYSNCLKHLAQVRFKRRLSGVINHIPNVLWSVLTSLSHYQTIRRIPWLDQVNALCLRLNFIKKEFKKLGAIIVPSKVLEKKFREYQFNPDALHYLPFGIDPPGKPYKIESDVLRIGFIGTLNHAKGAHILTNAVLRLPEGMNLEVKVYGDGSCFPGYSSTLEKHAVKDRRIKLCGTFSGDEIHKIFSEIDLLIIPSLWPENTPLVAYFAQFYRCPLVVSKIEGLADVVKDGKNGLFFTPGSVDELAQIIKQFYADPVSLDSMAKQAIQPKSMSQYSEELLNIYDSSLRERNL